MIRRLVTFALGLFFAALPATAQFYSMGSEPAGVAWYHIHTADYDVIYPRGLDSLARVYADILEKVKMPVGATAGYYPNQMYKKRLPVVLHPWTANSNGVVAWTPRRMELLTTPDALAPLPQPNENHLVIHESRHVAQMQYVNERRFRPVSFLVGELAAGAASALYCGPAFFEGDAVAAETELTAAGRGRQAAFLEYFRAAFREGDTRDWWRWRYGSLKHFTPDYYKVGYITMAGMRSVYGEPDFTARYYQRLFGSKWPLPFFVMPRTVKDVSGKRFRDAFTEISDTLRSRWNRDEISRAPFMPSEALTSDRRHFTEYISPCFLDGELYCIRSGMTATPQLVRIGADGTQSAVTHFAYSTSLLKPDAGRQRIWWSEIVQDPRWELKSYSEIWYAGTDGKRHRLSRGTRWYNPVPSPDGATVSATEYPVEGGSAVVLIDPENGSVQQRLIAPDGMQIAETEWIGSDMYACAVTAQGMGLYRWNGGVPVEVLALGPVSMKGLFCHNGRLCFTSDLSGVEELYAFDPCDGSVRRLTSSVQGGSYYCFAPDGSLVFSELTAGGRNLHRTGAEQLPEPAPADFSRLHRYEFAEDLAQSASASLAASDEDRATLDTGRGRGPLGKGREATSSSEATSEAERYNRLANLFRFHSWAPIYVSYDAVANASFEDLTTTAGLGATAFFQNHLNTMTGVVAYNASPEEKGWIHRGETIFTYSGLYPVVEASLSVSSGKPRLYFLQTGFTDFSRYLSLTSEDINGIPSFNAGIKTYIPLRFSSGGWYRGVIPQLQWSLSNSVFTRGSIAPMNRLSLSLRGYAIKATPQSCLYPKLGIGLEAGWSGRPWAQNILSSSAYIYGYGYLPGLMDTHGIRLSATLQTPTSDAIFNEHYAAVMPRGMAAYSGLASQYSGYPLQSRFTADYVFPFAPLDWSGLGPVAYLRNLECTLHGDLSYFKDGKSHQSLGSVGADLCAVLGNLLWIPEDTRIGVSYYYNIGAPKGESPHYWGAVFNVNF